MPLLLRQPCLRLGKCYGDGCQRCRCQGKPAGLKQAQNNDNTIYYVIGGAAIIAGIAILASSNNGGNNGGTVAPSGSSGTP